MKAAGERGLVAPGQPGAPAEEGGVLAGMLGLTFLAALGGCQQSESPCRPASSGVIGLLENSCHLSAVHYHFFFSHLWHSDPCGWHVVVLIL